MGKFALLVCLVSCGGSGGGGGGGGDDDQPQPDGGVVTQPAAACDVPAEGMLVDTSGSTNVVGTGTAASCTTEALQTAVTAGGLVKFNCGADPVTITLTKAITINNVAGADHLGDTVIDGGGLVTLSGNKANRILYLNACEMPFNNAHCDTFPHPHLTVERLTFVDAADDSTDGGGAIFRTGGALTVIDSVFLRNRCAMTGQDTAGGALRLIQATPALIVGSTFGTETDGNKCSDGGAIGALNASTVTIINSTFVGNQATGTGGNPGNGGNSGAIYYDGGNTTLTMCGVTVQKNHGNEYGGGMFYVDDLGKGTISISNSMITDNDGKFAGGAYLQGANVTMANVTIANNTANFAPQLYENSMNGRGTLDATNLTIAGATGDGAHLEGGVTGTFLNATLPNQTTGAGGIQMINTIGSMCDAAPAMAMSVIGTSCGGTAGDPMLGTLGDNGGTTHVFTMAPAAGSPAAGAGAMMCPTTDARGMARPATGCTAGAHQL
ncbi:MAG: choice-of-anchor Q domain-containing protein [Kofleriaceae bacterium]